MVGLGEVNEKRGRYEATSLMDADQIIAVNANFLCHHASARPDLGVFFRKMIRFLAWSSCIETSC